MTSPLAGASVAVASPAVTPAPAASPDLLADVAAVEAQVPPLRQLQPLWPVPTRIIDADQLRRTLEQEIDAPANVAAMSAEQGLLIRLGLAAPGLDLQALSLATLTSQVLGRVPSLGKMLGAGWTRAYLDTLGEVTFQVWLDQALEADAARQLAADWTGDQVVSWSGPIRRLGHRVALDVGVGQFRAGANVEWPIGRWRLHSPQADLPCMSSASRARRSPCCSRPIGPRSIASRSGWAAEQGQLAGAGPRGALRDARHYIESGADTPSNASVFASASRVAVTSASRAPDVAGFAVSITRRSL